MIIKKVHCIDQNKTYMKALTESHKLNTNLLIVCFFSFRPDILWIYKISYVWYTPISVVICVSIGTIVSIITGTCTINFAKYYLYSNRLKM